eukprot:TRINITY_DN52816_c0_g1_i1.p1 TRINITY_DN52816_c0_g1~~TRINITY_DN52816_c0_g1_i1.p1  ORF type:complete len:185 (-),score=28.90 TRINITY_DN52816_c0_g1_i1:99-653(-)
MPLWDREVVGLESQAFRRFRIQPYDAKFILVTFVMAALFAHGVRTDESGDVSSKSVLEASRGIDHVNGHGHEHHHKHRVSQLHHRSARATEDPERQEAEDPSIMKASDAQAAAAEDVKRKVSDTLDHLKGHLSLVDSTARWAADKVGTAAEAAKQHATAAKQSADSVARDAVEANPRYENAGHL